MTHTDRDHQGIRKLLAKNIRERNPALVYLEYEKERLDAELKILTMIALLPVFIKKAPWYVRLWLWCTRRMT